MIRPYFVTFAAGAALMLLPAAAFADRSNRDTPGQERQAEATSGNFQLSWAGQNGKASYYGKAHHGKRTASGARFDQNAMTAAHPWLPFGTRIRVTHAATGRSVVVVINDRLPSKRRVLDLSLGAAQALGIIRQGVATVEITLA